MTGTRTPITKCGCLSCRESDALLEQSLANKRAAFEVWLREEYMPRKAAKAVADAAEVDAAVAEVERVLADKVPA